MSEELDASAGLARKARSEARLRQTGVLLNEALPWLGRNGIRTPEEIAYRASALILVALRAEVCLSGQHTNPLAQNILTERKLWDSVTPLERAFLDKAAPTEHEALQFVWRYEGVLVLLWALGLAEELPYPTDICDVPWLAAFFRDHTVETLLAEARPRSEDELLDACDYIFRLHWAVRNAQYGGTAHPEGVDGGVVYERHYALNWLTRFFDAEWDDTDTPT